MTKTYQIKPYLKVRSAGSSILIGTLPPIGKIIEDAPKYLGTLLNFLSDPHKEIEIIEFLKNQGNLSNSEANLVFEDLLENRIIGEYFYKRDERYSRHKLYFDLIGIDEPVAKYDTLKDKIVGLIGMGGIGSNVAMNLAGAGVGTLIFSDGDIIEQTNLTRQFLYRESDVGKYKVDVAKERLSEIDSSLILKPVNERIADANIFYKYFSKCDFIVISADSPAAIHDWINDAAIDLGFAYSNAGYIEKFGIIGPLVKPGETACYECYKYENPFATKANFEKQGIELNQIHQAPSYGPLNTMVASIQSNEVIRYLLGMKNKTFSTRLLIDSETYRIFEENFSRDEKCESCSILQIEKGLNTIRDQSLSIEDIYSCEETNLNDLILTPFMENLIQVKPNEQILEIGAGPGKLGSFLKRMGAIVDFNDLSAKLLQTIPNRDGSEFYEGNFLDLDIEKKYDLIICNNVLDFVEDLDIAVTKIANLLNVSGRIYITIPHPIKDTGYWLKEKYNGRWNYNQYLLNNYFMNGKVQKKREDSNGNIVSRGIESYHRTISDYFDVFLRQNFEVLEVYEPHPEEDFSATQPVLYEKSINIPYFLTIGLKKNG